MNDEEKIRRLEIRANVLLSRFEEFLSKIVKKVIGTDVEVRFVDVKECQYHGYKIDSRNRICLNKSLLGVMGRYPLHVLFHEACHDLVFIHYFKGDLKKRNEVYLRFDEQRCWHENPEEIICESFGCEVARSMPRWVVECTETFGSEMRFILRELEISKELGHTSLGYDEAMKKSFKLEAYIKKCMKMLDEKPLPKVHTQMIKDMVDFLKRHGYG